MITIQKKWNSGVKSWPKITSILTFFFSLNFGWNQAYCQSELVQFVDSVFEKSNSKKKIELGRKITHFENLRSLSVLKPSFVLSSKLPDYSRTIGAITQPDGSLKFEPQSQSYSTLAIGANQVLAKTGGKFSLYSGINRIDLFDPVRINSWSTNAFILTYSQPLFSGNDLKYLKSNISRKSEIDRLMQNEEEALLKGNVTNKLIDLYIYYAKLNIVQQQDSISREVLTGAQHLFESGRLLEYELKLLKIDNLNKRNTIIRLHQIIKSIQNNLSLELGIEIDSSFYNRLDVENWTYPSVSRDSLLKLAYGHSAWNNLLNTIELNRQDLQILKTSKGLQGNLDISFGLNQRANSLEDAYNNPLNRQTAAINLTIPITDGGNRNYEVLQKESQLEQLNMDKSIKEQQMLQSVDVFLFNFNQRKKEIKLQRETTVSLNEQLEIHKTLFLSGKIDTKEYLKVLEMADEAVFQYYGSTSDFWKEYFSPWTFL